jgi:phosphoribosyl 1,2-cyclic phosphate phosphodiesterase
MPVLGIRFGDIAYITDISSIPEEEFTKLKGLKHLTLNTVSYHPHHSHFSLSEAVELAGRIGAEHTWLTHLSHTFPSHSQFDRELPDGISPAYDGLVITD